MPWPASWPPWVVLTELLEEVLRVELAQLVRVDAAEARHRAARSAGSAAVGDSSPAGSAGSAGSAGLAGHPGTGSCGHRPDPGSPSRPRSNRPASRPLRRWRPRRRARARARRSRRSSWRSIVGRPWPPLPDALSRVGRPVGESGTPGPAIGDASLGDAAYAAYAYGVAGGVTGIALVGAEGSCCVSSTAAGRPGSNCGSAGRRRLGRNLRGGLVAHGHHGRADPCASAVAQPSRRWDFGTPGQRLHRNRTGRYWSSHSPAGFTG